MSKLDATTGVPVVKDELRSSYRDIESRDGAKEKVVLFSEKRVQTSGKDYNGGMLERMEDPNINF